MAESTPALIIVMGVSGCGKSTLAEHLAEHLDWQFMEADDFHSEKNKQHMASGKPLTDAMREPWIKNMCEHVKALKKQGISSVLAYSGLRHAHRNQFRQLGLPVLFLHLSGPKEVVLNRMQSRSDHFMPTTLLDSQYDALEPTDNETDIVDIDLSLPIKGIVDKAERIVAEFIQAQS